MPTIAELRAEAEQKYTDLPIVREDGTTVSLRNLLRLDDTARTNAQVLIKSLEDQPAKKKGGQDDFDELGRQERIVRDLLLLVSDDPAAMKDEIAGWDMPLLMHVMERWTESTQPGEASSSPSS